MLPFNIDHIDPIKNITPKITINEQLQTTKILGIYFNKNLKNANQINWDNTLEKMEKHKYIIVQNTIPIRQNYFNKHTYTLKNILSK